MGTLSQPHGNAARIYPRVFGRNEVERENKELRFISLFLKSPLDVLNEGMLDTCVKNDDRNKKKLKKSKIFQSRNGKKVIIYLPLIILLFDKKCVTKKNKNIGKYNIYITQCQMPVPTPFCVHMRQPICLLSVS